MLGPILRRKFARDLRANRVKVAVSIIIVALGVSGYFSYTQEARNLEASYQTTYQELGLAHYWVELALPAPAQTFNVLAREPEVEELQPRLHLFGRFQPTHETLNGSGEAIAHPKLAELLGTPSQTGGMNRLRILEGQGLEGDLSSVRAAGELPLVVEHQAVEYHGLKVGSTVELTLPRFDPLAVLEAFNATGGDPANVTPYQLGGGLALTSVNVTGRVVGVAISPEYLVVTGNEGVLVPRPRSVGVFFTNLTDLQLVTNLTALPGFEEYGGFVNEASLKAPGLDDLEVLMARPGPADLVPLVEQTKGREDQHSVKILQQDLQGFKQLTPPLSGLVLAVAGFTIAMNLQRILASQRRQIGILRALGASSGQVLVYYGSFALVIGLAGSLLGLILGILQSDYLTKAYAEALGLPEVEVRWELIVALQGLLFGLGMSLLFGIGAARRAAQLRPREAMAPAHPVRASPGLARFTQGRALVLRLGLRNLSRNRLRSVLTVGGLGFALILPLSLGGILGSFDHAIDQAFDHPQWSGTAVLATPQPQAQAVNDLESRPGIEAAVPYVDMTVTAKGQQVALTGLYHSNLFQIHTTTGRFHFQAPLPGADPRGDLVIDALFASQFDLKKGDALTLTLLGVQREVKVVAINTEILTHFYLPLPFLQQWWAEADRLAHPPNGTLPQAPVTGLYLTGDVSALKASNDVPPYVVEVVEAGELRGQVEDLMELFTFYVNLFYLIGIVMGLLIITNGATLNLLERETELATLKTLGADERLLSKVVALENLCLGLLGGLLGVALAYPVTALLLKEFTGDIFYVPLHMPTHLPLTALVLLVLLSLLATFPTYHRLRNFDLAVAVREVER